MRKNNFSLICGDALEVLPRLEPESVDCVFTSPNPPFWTKAKPGMVGSEPDLHEYISKLDHIFARAYMSLKETGSLWVHSKDTRFTNGCYMMIPESLANKWYCVGWILRDKCIWYRSNTEDTDPNCWSEDWDYLYRFTKRTSPEESRM